MAENTEQTKRDALFLLDALKHVTTKVVVNAGEIALQKDVKVNTIETRFSAIRARHNLNIGTTTSGFPKQKPSTPKKLPATPQLKAIEGPAGNHPRSARTPKPSAKKRQADQDDGWSGGDYERESTPSKRYRTDLEEDNPGWHVMASDDYDGVYVLDGARGLGY